MVALRGGLCHRGMVERVVVLGCAWGYAPMSLTFEERGRGHYRGPVVIQRQREGSRPRPRHQHRIGGAGREFHLVGQRALAMPGSLAGRGLVMVVGVVVKSGVTRFLWGWAD